MRARWRTEMDVCRLQENRAMCGTALENLQRRRQRVLVKREDPTALKVFPLGSSLGGDMLYSLQPCAAAQRCHTTVLLMASHCPPNPTDPSKSFEPDVGVQDLLFQWLGSGLGPFNSPKPTKTFLSTVLCLSEIMVSNYLP